MGKEGGLGSSWLLLKETASTRINTVPWMDMDLDKINNGPVDLCQIPVKTIGQKGLKFYHRLIRLILEVCR